jgi:hypothetical protein
MSNYLSGSSQEKGERSKEPHAIWRGIGFIMMVLIPVVSFAMSDKLLQYARTRGVTIPEELRTNPMPIPVYGDVVDLYAVLILAVAIMLVLYGMFTIINAAVYRASAERTYQVFESKPQRYKKKRKLKKP